jgi:predicted ATPase/DNA-binding winged helix-turn-helix (wHTH) protein
MSKSDEKQLTVYRFGRFEVNAKEQLLRRDGEIVPLTPKIFETLLLLVRNNGRMLSKDEIMETVWADSFVEETNLTSNISRLRKILHAGGEHFIETFPKRGYRFFGEVEEIAPDSEIILTRRVRAQIRQVVEETDEIEPPYAALLAAAPNNLTAPFAPIVGREKEIAEIENLLKKSRLVTLTGVGGTGKTRLAREIACRALANFADGVFFVALADVRKPDLVASAIAQIFGVKESKENSLLENLKNFFSEKNLLLAVDNFEQIVSAAPVLAEILAAAPRVRILATSRILLHLPQEREFRVPPLDLPETLSELESLSQNEAVKLFIERANKVKSSFALTAENAASVAEICRRLEGLPLAIELAAARIKILSPQSIAARLENCLKILTGGAKDAPARQQTMRGAIDWSWDLLDADEKKLFRRVSIFAGGLTIDAAESVCASNEIDLYNCLTALVESSLLGQIELSGGESRFRLLEVVREYGLEKLANDGELAEMQRRHAEFFLNLATTAQPALSGAEQTKWLSILETEHDNLRAALAWSFEHDAETTLRLARALGQFWYVRGHLSEGSANFREVLSRTTDLLVAVRGEALVGAGILEQRRGDVGKSRELFTEARAVGEKVGDADIIATALNGLGIGAAVEGDETAARAFLEEGLRVSQAAKNQRYIGLFLNNLGEHARRRGDYAEARRLYAESLIIQRELGNTRIVGIALGNLGRVSYLQNDFAAARQFYAESLEISRSLGDLHSIAQLLDGFAGLKAETQPERAAQLLSAANALRQKVGSDFDQADADFYVKIYQTIEANLERENFAKQLRVGSAMSLAQSVSLALDS